MRFASDTVCQTHARLTSTLPSYQHNTHRHIIPPSMPSLNHIRNLFADMAFERIDFPEHFEVLRQPFDADGRCAHLTDGGNTRVIGYLLRRDDHRRPPPL